MPNRIEIARYLAAHRFQTDDVHIDDNAEVAPVEEHGIWVAAWILIPKDDINSAMVDPSPMPLHR